MKSFLKESTSIIQPAQSLDHKHVSLPNLTPSNPIEIVDNRPETIIQRKIQTLMQNSPYMQRATQLQSLTNKNSQMLEKPNDLKSSEGIVQRKPYVNVPMGGKFDSGNVDIRLKIDLASDSQVELLRKMIAEDIRSASRNEVGNITQPLLLRLALRTALLDTDSPEIRFRINFLIETLNVLIGENDRIQGLIHPDFNDDDYEPGEDSSSLAEWDEKNDGIKGGVKMGLSGFGE